MIEVAPLIPGDLRCIRLQPAQAYLAAHVETVDPLLPVLGRAYTVLNRGRPIAAGGVMLGELPLPVAWAFLSEEVGQHMLAVTRYVRAFLDGWDSGPVETGVIPDHAAGHRWARLLGFQRTAQGVDWWGNGRLFDVYRRG